MEAPNVKDDPGAKVAKAKKAQIVHFFNCALCSFECRVDSELKMHVDLNHLDDLFKFPCDLCEFVGQGPKYLREHKSQQHDGQKNPDANAGQPNALDPNAGKPSSVESHQNIPENPVENASTEELVAGKPTANAEDSKAEENFEVATAQQKLSEIVTPDVLQSIQKVPNAASSVETLNEAIETEITSKKSLSEDEEDKPLNVNAKRRRRSVFETDTSEDPSARPKREVKMPKKLQDAELLSLNTSQDDSIESEESKPLKTPKKSRRRRSAKGSDDEDWKEDESSSVEGEDDDPDFIGDDPDFVKDEPAKPKKAAPPASKRLKSVGKRGPQMKKPAVPEESSTEDDDDDGDEDANDDDPDFVEEAPVKRALNPASKRARKGVVGKRGRQKKKPDEDENDDDPDFIDDDPDFIEDEPAKPKRAAPPASKRLKSVGKRGPQKKKPVEPIIKEPIVEPVEDEFEPPMLAIRPTSGPIAVVVKAPPPRASPSTLVSNPAYKEPTSYIKVVPYYKEVSTREPVPVPPKAQEEDSDDDIQVICEVEKPKAKIGPKSKMGPRSKMNLDGHLSSSSSEEVIIDDQFSDALSRKCVISVQGLQCRLCNTYKTTSREQLQIHTDQYHPVQ